MAWKGKIDAVRLAAQADGRNVSWDNPISIQFALHETKDGLRVDCATCTSSFLEVDASGSIDAVTASAKFDLAQLVAELRQFSDLHQLQLAGQGAAALNWKRADDKFTADGRFTATGFQLVPPHGQPWTEQQVVAQFAAAGQLNDLAVTRIESANLDVEAGEEHFTAQLKEPVAIAAERAAAASPPRGAARWPTGDRASNRASASPAGIRPAQEPFNCACLLVQGDRNRNRES